jgi:hypothetical protein
VTTKINGRQSFIFRMKDLKAENEERKPFNLRFAKEIEKGIQDGLILPPANPMQAGSCNECGEVFCLEKRRKSCHNCTRYKDKEGEEKQANCVECGKLFTKNKHNQVACSGCKIIHRRKVIKKCDERLRDERRAERNRDIHSPGTKKLWRDALKKAIDPKV